MHLTLFSLGRCVANCSWVTVSVFHYRPSFTVPVGKVLARRGMKVDLKLALSLLVFSLLLLSWLLRPPNPVHRSPGLTLLPELTPRPSTPDGSRSLRTHFRSSFSCRCTASAHYNRHTYRKSATQSSKKKTTKMNSKGGYSLYLGLFFPLKFMHSFRTKATIIHSVWKQSNKSHFC